MDPFLIAIFLFLAALLLAGIDVFVPSGGILLVLAVAAAVGSILFGFRSSLSMGMAMLTAVAASVPVGAFLAIKIWPHTPIGKMVILKAPAAEPPTAEQDEMQSWVGRVLKTDSDLMPSGQIKVGYRRLNAIAQSSFIEAGQVIKIIAVRERCLVVRPSSEPLTPWEAVSTTQSHASSNAPAPNLLDVPAEDLGLDSLRD